MSAITLGAGGTHVVSCACGYSHSHMDVHEAIQDYTSHACGEAHHTCGRDFDPSCDGCRMAAGDAGGEF